MVLSKKALENYKKSVLNEILADIKKLKLGDSVVKKIETVVCPVIKKRNPIVIPLEKRCGQKTIAGGKCSAPKCTDKCWAHMSKKEKEGYIPKDKKNNK